jgi:hypothetical protein
MDKEENPISASSIHISALVGAGSLWPMIFLISYHQMLISFGSYEDYDP